MWNYRVCRLTENQNTENKTLVLQFAVGSFITAIVVVVSFCNRSFSSSSSNSLFISSFPFLLPNQTTHVFPVAETPKITPQTKQNIKTTCTCKKKEKDIRTRDTHIYTVFVLCFVLLSSFLPSFLTFLHFLSFSHKRRRVREHSCSCTCRHQTSRSQVLFVFWLCCFSGIPCARTKIVLGSHQVQVCCCCWIHPCAH